MARSDNYKTMYFNDEYVKYINTYLNNFSDWVKLKVKEEMDNTPGFCIETIEKKKRDVKKWEERLKVAQKTQYECEKAVKKLITACVNRTPEQRKQFLTGKTGKSLLRIAKMSQSWFLEELKEYKEK